MQSIYWTRENGDTANVETSPPISFPITLAPRFKGNVPASVTIPIKSQDSIPETGLIVNAHVPGESRAYESRAATYHPALSSHPIPVTSGLDMNFIEQTGDGQSYRVRAGSWIVHEPLILPRGSSLEVGPGTTLSFARRAFLLVRGPVSFVGTVDQPIVFEGIVDSEGSGAWQGIVVMEASSSSEWSHVTVRQTSGIKYPSWSLTGGVTFYYSDIKMNQVQFTGNVGEDALNIIHSDFDLEDIRISDTASDAFDSDFSTGVIRGSLFQDIGQIGGGDAFDLSGSDVTMADTRFFRINDKALSVGENSRLTADRIEVEDVGTGAASKDRSQLHISDSTIKGARVAGLLAYIKKSEYGPARLTTESTTISDCEIPAKVQIGSYLSQDGEILNTEVLDVDDLYKTVMKRGGR